MHKNTTTANVTPRILSKFIVGFGHADHVFSLILSYLVSPSIRHWLHRIPKYPSSQSTGWSFPALYPPSQASMFGHSIILVLLASILQYPLFKLIISPSQLALLGHDSHFVAFQVTENVPVVQNNHIVSIWISPGLHHLKSTLNI
jgi:hypothetical protein